MVLRVGEELPPIMKEEVQKVIESLKSGKAPGPDEVGNETLKILADAIVKPLTNIFNLILKTGVPPTQCPTEGCVKVCQWLSHCLHRGSLCAGRYTPIEVVVDKRKRVYSATLRINPKSRKMLWIRHERRQVMLCK